MKQQFFAVILPGTITAQGTYVLNLQGSKPGKSSLNGVMGWWKRFLGICCIGVLWFGAVNAQNYDTLNVANLGFQIVAPQIVLSEGETVTLDIITDEVIQAREVDVYLELGTEAVFPSEPEIALANSWFFTSTNVPSTIGTNVITRRVNLDGVSTSPQSGSGVLFQLTLEAGEDGVSAVDLIEDGGGLVMVEDLGFNPVLSSAKAKVRPRLYPNPCHDRLGIDWQDTQPQYIKVYDQEGNQVMNQKMGAILPSVFSLGHLPRGLYLVVIEFEDHRLVEKLLLI